MDAFIAWLGNADPLVLLLIAGFVLLPSVFVYAMRAGRRNFPAWLAASLVPVLGWLVVCVLLLMPEPQSESDTHGEAPAGGRFWGRIGLGFLGLALVSKFAWKSDNSPPLLPTFDEPIVRSEIHAFAKQLTFESLGKDSGALKIVQVEETPSKDPATQRAGRVTVQHAKGQDFFEVTMVRMVADPGKYQLAVGWDTREMLSPDYWRVRDLLRRELGQLPEVRELQLADQQWADLKVTEKPSETPQSLRMGRVELPAGEGRVSRVWDFLVHWCDQAESCAGIQLIEAELPQPSSPAFQHELKHAVQDWPPFAPQPGAQEAQLKSLQMSHSDPEKQQWFYKVQVQSGEEDRVVSVVLQWRNRDLGLWEVKILDEPPAN